MSSPKITEKGGASFPPVDEPAYNDAMGRHGTDRFTEDDARTVERWHGQRARQAEERGEPVAEDTARGAADGDSAVDRSEEYERMTKVELEAELRHRQLPTSGGKADLVMRLVANDGERAAELDDTDPAA